MPIHKMEIVKREIIIINTSITTNTNINTLFLIQISFLYFGKNKAKIPML